jgi:alginate O-acetyltransferase complex protein AlgI
MAQNGHFLAWGIINAIYFLPSLLLKNNRKHLDVVAANKILPNIRESLQIILTFGLVTFSWIFFRSESISQAYDIIRIIFSPSLISRPSVGLSEKINIILIIILIFFEWLGRKDEFSLKFLSKKNFVLRWGTYVTILIIMGLFMSTEISDFIYFQF